MTLILEYRDKIKKFYRMNCVVIVPILKFLIAFIALNGVNTMMGYMPKLDTLTIVMITSLACSFLPAGCLILLCALFSLGHMFSLSLEVALVGFVFYVLIYLLLLRFAPRDSYVVILTPLFLAMKIPYVIPIAVGLIGSPLSAISVACGVIVYYVLGMVVDCAPAISTMESSDITGKVTFLVESLIKNKSMLVIAACFAITVIVVWVIRRLPIEHCWTIAMSAGAMVNLGLLLVGDLKYDIGLSLGSAILGSLLAVLVAKVIEFFRFCVDYGRTERVQFEDDEYYYYVKAVPKMVIAAPTKTVKRINSNTQSLPAFSDGQGRSAEGRRGSAQTRTTGQGNRVRTPGQGNRPASQQVKPQPGQSSRQPGQQRPVERPQERPQERRPRPMPEDLKETRWTEPEQQPEIRETYESEEEMGQTKMMSLIWNSGQAKSTVRAATATVERSSRQSITGVSQRQLEEQATAQITSGSAAYGEGYGENDNNDVNESDDYEELF